ncbi:MAG: PilZ domain-containing protein [Candidatus Omnitrophica bacterium]|nr:PilZ domain-containing protein [Candidatus Omnitrophota bacterium]
MKEWELKDRRRFVRFPVCISLEYGEDLKVNAEKNISARTSDISVKGVGVITHEELTPGATLDIWLCMPDNGELIEAKGKVVWHTLIEHNKYRIGICLEEADLKPIPLVLRSLQNRR